MATAQKPARAQTRTRPAKTEYLNTTQGWLGAVTVDRQGKDKPIPIPPGGRVFLTDEERELTEQAHQRAEDSPFHPREVVYRDPNTGDEISRATLAPLEEADQFRRSGGKILPATPPVVMP